MTQHPGVEDVADRDPRVNRALGSSLDDLWDALYETDRTRLFYIGGLQGEAHAPEDLNDDPGAREAQAERKAIARAELEAGTPFINATSMVFLLSAVDAFIEELSPEHVKAFAIVKMRLERANALDPDLASQVSDDAKAAVERVLYDRVLSDMKRKKVFGVGVERYETALKRLGLDARDREMPEDFQDALKEAVALRHVLVHRGGRVDGKAGKDAPTLRYGVGEFVRLTGDDYRRYSAAIRAYATEVDRRLHALFGIDTGTHLRHWRDERFINA